MIYRIYTKAFIQGHSSLFGMFKRFSGAIAARRMLLERCLPLKDIEELNTSCALDRVASEDIRSSADLPAFDRSAMDGYAFDGAQLVPLAVPQRKPNNKDITA